MSQVRAVAHRGDGAASEVDPQDIDVLLAERGTLLWLDIQDADTSDLELLRSEFSFHELSLEDALVRHQRPKVDEYDGYYFIVIYSASIGSAQRISTHELHCFWGSNYLVTLHDGPIAEVSVAIDRWAASHERRRHGVAFQAYTLLDAVVDGYFPVLDAVADRCEDLEARVFSTDESVMREIFDIRRNLFDVRRRIAPSRDILNELIRRDIPIFPPTLVPYLSDVYDHTIRAIDGLDLHRDLLSSAMESHLSAISNQLNVTMRTMTALTIGLMGPTLIAGVYGMNYQLWPSNDWPYGFPMSVGAMILTLIVTLLIFRRVKWL
jgi:magnesium transporter